MPRKASPLSSSSIGNFTWCYIFIHHMICVLLGASCIICVFAFSLPQSSLLYTPFGRDTHESEFIRIFYVLYLNLFELWNCSTASLISFWARQWLYLKEIDELSCFNYIFLRVDNSNGNLHKIWIWSQCDEYSRR